MTGNFSYKNIYGGIISKLVALKFAHSKITKKKRVKFLKYYPSNDDLGPKIY